MPEKWTIIGASGFIGKNLCLNLQASGKTVRALDRNLKPSIYDERILWTQGSFLDTNALSESIADSEIVVHLVSTVTPASSNMDPIRDAEENLIGSIKIMNICKEQKIKKLIILSSGGTIYGNYSSPIQEEFPCDPLCSYGIIKLAIEKYAALYNKFEHFDSTILRVSNPYGPYQFPKGQGFIATAINLALRNQTIEVWGNGNTIRDYVYIDDVIESIKLAAHTKTLHQVYNIGSGQGRSIKNVLEAICSIHGELDIKYYPPRAVDVPINILDINRAKEYLNWSPKETWEDGINKTYNWLKLNIDK